VVIMVETKFVEHLPDLIEPDEYAGDPKGRRVRLRITVTEDGLQILGDAVRVLELEKILEELGPQAIEQMLCG
jgi:hypothetical protein